MRRSSSVMVLFVAAMVLLAGQPAAAESEADGGYFRIISDGGKGTLHFLFWHWSPYYAPGTADYKLYIRCTRENKDGVPVNSGKVKFTNIVFARVGAPSAIVVDKKITWKFKRFHEEGYLVLEVPELVNIADAPFVAVELLADVKARLRPGDQVVCTEEVRETVQ